MPEQDRMIEELALAAVERMGDIFYDADAYPNERVACQECGEDVKVRERICPVCGHDFGPDGASRNARIHEMAVACVVDAIRQAQVLLDWSDGLPGGD